jgi:hypothetical protein
VNDDERDDLMRRLVLALESLAQDAPKLTSELHQCRRTATQIAGDLKKGAGMAGLGKALGGLFGRH